MDDLRGLCPVPSGGGEEEQLIPPLLQGLDRVDFLLFPADSRFGRPPQRPHRFAGGQRGALQVFEGPDRAKRGALKALKGLLQELEGVLDGLKVMDKTQKALLELL